MHGIWKDMFVITLPILEKILRPVIVYFFLVVMLRLSGKRELVQLNPFDLVVLLTLSNTVQNAIIGDDNSVSGGLLGATSLLPQSRDDTIILLLETFEGDAEPHLDFRTGVDGFLQNGLDLDL